MAGKQQIFSELSHPFMVAWDDEKHITIFPHISEVDSDLWEEAKELDQVKNRLDNGRIRELEAGEEPSPRDQRALQRGHDPSMIRELSVKAVEIPDESNNQGVLDRLPPGKALELAKKEIRELKRIQGQ